jgi:hypothetical protein
VTAWLYMHTLSMVRRRFRFHRLVRTVWTVCQSLPPQLRDTVVPVFWDVDREDQNYAPDIEWWYPDPEVMSCYECRLRNVYWRDQGQRRLVIEWSSAANEDVVAVKYFCCLGCVRKWFRDHNQLDD